MKNLDIFLIYLLFIFGIFPSINTFNPNFNENIFTVGWGLNAVDLVLIFMLLVTSFRFIRGDYKNYYNLNLKILIITLFIYLVFEIIRNISKYGLSAPGEFRFRYLVLALPIFVALNFNTDKKTKSLIKFLIYFGYFFPLLYIPIIGINKGWYFGEYNRFLNSQIYLGMVYSILLLYFLNKYNIYSFNKKLFLISLLPSTLFFILDSHRSAWMAAIAIVLLLFYLKEIQIKNFLFFIPITLVLLLFVYQFTSDIGLDLSEYVSRRGEAYINPEYDGTSKWRLIMWELQLEKFYKSPLFGEGFGGYWEVVFPDGQIVNISPHSYYVQSLVKIGIIGLLLYLIIIFKLIKKFWQRIKSSKSLYEITFYKIGVITVLTMHLYYVVYSVDYYSLIYLGLAASFLFRNNDIHNYPSTQS